MPEVGSFDQAARVQTLKAECLLDSKAILGEGPVWRAETNDLIWVDIESAKVFCFSPSLGENRSWHVGEKVGLAVPTSKGDLILGMTIGLARLDLQSGNLAPIIDPENFLTVRAIKMYADGALGSRGAALLEKYSDYDGKGVFIFLEEETKPRLSKALKKGIQIGTHAIGDHGNRVVLDWYEEAFTNAKKNKKFSESPRWRIEHSQNIKPVDQRRFVELGVIPSMQPSHAIGDLHFAVDRLGLERINDAYAWRNLIDQGLIIAGGTDAPVEIGDPRIEFYAAVARKDVDGYHGEGWNLDQRLSRLEALKMFTIWPAIASFEEDIKGTIEVGKLADFSVFDQDLMNIPELKILESNNILTVVDGRVVYQN